MQKKHRTLWAILSIFVLVSMVLFSVLPYLQAAEINTIGTIPISTETTSPTNAPTSTTPTNDDGGLNANPYGASVTATVPETEFNRPKKITTIINSFKNVDPYILLLGGSLIVALVLFLVIFNVWRKNKNSSQK